MTPEEIFDTLEKVRKLYEFSKKQGFKLVFTLGRRNGKTQLVNRFIKEYNAIITAYERAECTPRCWSFRRLLLRIKCLFTNPFSHKRIKALSAKHDGYSTCIICIDKMHELKPIKEGEE